MNTIKEVMQFVGIINIFVFLLGFTLWLWYAQITNLFTFPYISLIILTIGTICSLYFMYSLGVKYE